MKRVAIIGGGISGLTALHFLRHRHADQVEVTLFEKDNRLGGTIGTDREGGFISDWGPNGFLDKVALTLQVVAELGLDDKLDSANPRSEKRFIYRYGSLHEINPSPAKFLRSGVLKLSGRLRLITEPLIKARRDDNDESIFDFAWRRIGREAAENLVAPMVSGIYGGDAKKLSLRACFPVMEQMERESGSLFKAMITRKKAGSKGGPAGPGGILTSFHGGLYTIIERLNEKYADFIHTGAPITSLTRDGNCYRLQIEADVSDLFDGVICAAPAYKASELTKSLDEKLSALLASIPYAPIAVVSLGYKRSDIDHDLDGFGFLVPQVEGLRILGSIWTSSIFSDRAPEGMVQLRSMIGGATDVESINWDDNRLIGTVRGDLGKILGVTAEPVFTKIFRWKQGIPQFILGHPEKMRQLEQMTSAWSGLYFTGNAYDGIGLNDCVVRSEKAVRQIIDTLT